MDFLTGAPAPLYRRYLTASVGRTLAVSIYSFVDTLAVGQSADPLASAAVAAIATATGTTLQCVIMCSHFLHLRCRLRLVKPFSLGKALGKIFSLGFGSSALYLGTVVLGALMNTKINRYGSMEALAVYGVGSTIAVLF